jgi:RimJ/RimL family protein N-acetyltransferase
MNQPNGYKVLAGVCFTKNSYLIESIRLEDAIPVMEWRNAQMDALRQKEPLSEGKQLSYFKNLIEQVLPSRLPAQILVRFTHEDRLIGYGGLVHIDWKDKRAEVSFLLETEIAKDPQQYETHFRHFLALIQKLAFAHLGFHKITTESFAHRKKHVKIIENCGFTRDGVLRDQTRVEGKWVNAVVCSCLQSEYDLKEMG